MNPRTVRLAQALIGALVDAIPSQSTREAFYRRALRAVVAGGWDFDTVRLRGLDNVLDRLTSDRLVRDARNDADVSDSWRGDD